MAVGSAVVLMSFFLTSNTSASRSFVRQLQLIDQALDVLHEEIAASRAGESGSLVLFVVSLLIPVGMSAWLLVRAERSLINTDQTLRCMIHFGLHDTVVRHYLSGRREPQFILPSPAHGGHLPHPGRTAWRRRHGRRRRRRHLKRSRRDS